MTVREKVVGGYSGSNSPFVMGLYLIRKSDVVSLLDPVRFPPEQGHLIGYLPAGGLRLKTGAEVTRMKFPPMSCVFEQTTARTDSGVRYVSVIEFPMPGVRPDLEQWLFENREQQFVALVETPDGTAWIVGNEDRGLRAGAVITVGAVKQHLLTIGGELASPLFYLPYSYIDLATIFPSTDFSIEFSLDFNA